MHGTKTSMYPTPAAGRCSTALRPTFPTALSAVLLVGALASAVRGEPPKAADFPELTVAYRPIEKLVAGSAIVVGNRDLAEAFGPQTTLSPLPAETPILAFEENSLFLCATADASRALGPRPADQDGKPGARFARRIVLLKPSVFIIDDYVSQPAGDRPLRWLLRCSGEATVAGQQVRINGPDQEIRCQTLWPPGAALQRVPETAGAAGTVYQIEATPKRGADGVRWLHVLQLRPSGGNGTPVKASVAKARGHLDLNVATADRTFRLTLPPPGTGAGWIAVEGTDGKTIVPRRPLPAGVLPHGAEGMQLVERWDRAYRDGRRPPWDTGVPAEELQRVVDEGIVRPCRTVVLGCGSGTNAIYLAGKGFDVTAIDVAPTALAIAQTKAEKAGVKVHWLLADVLAPPKVKPFDFLFDRGCYHNVRYVDAAGFVESVRRISRPGTRFLLLSLNRDGPPGVREHHMRDDFSTLFEFEWLRDSSIRTGADGANRRESWSAMLRRKPGK